MKIDWLSNGEDESIPRCPECGLSGPELEDMSGWCSLCNTRYCLRCLVELEEE